MRPRSRGPRRHSGFTLAELVIVLLVSAALLPTLFALARNLEDQRDRAFWRLEVATSIRTIAEELRRDASWDPGADGVSFQSGACEVRYKVDDHLALVRQASPECGGSRGLARGVGAIRRVTGGVELEFVSRRRPTRTDTLVVFLPVVAP